ncbi:PDZ domain-containing protein [Exiguobacterium artemiae]
MYNGSPTGDSVIGTVQKGSPADKAGLVEGDRIVSVNGTETDKWTDLRAGFQDQAGKRRRSSMNETVRNKRRPSHRKSNSKVIKKSESSV